MPFYEYAPSNFQQDWEVSNYSYPHMIGGVTAVTCPMNPSDSSFYPPNQDLLLLDGSISNFNDQYHNNNGDRNIEYEKDHWRYKPVKQWTSRDILWWLNYEADRLGVNCTKLAGEEFCKLDGLALSEMSLSQFKKCDHNYGEILYRSLQQILLNSKSSSYDAPVMSAQTHCDTTFTEIGSLESSCASKYELQDLTNLDYTQDRDMSSRRCPRNQDGMITKKKIVCQPLKKNKLGPGRPKGPKKKEKPEKKLGRLWEFIRDLLKDPKSCPVIIAWENHDEGTFRIVNSDQLAKLWGGRKGNPYMNYEKLSRAMRYYYKSQVLLPVIGRRLVYKFGPTATDWRVDNPNFKKIV